LFHIHTENEEYERLNSKSWKAENDFRIFFNTDLPSWRITVSFTNAMNYFWQAEIRFLYPRCFILRVKININSMYIPSSGKKNPYQIENVRLPEF